MNQQKFKDSPAGKDYFIFSDTEQCFLCGKPIKTPKYYFHVVEGGGQVLRNGEEYDNPAGDLGIKFIGKNCRKKLLPEYEHYISRLIKGVLK